VKESLFFAIDIGQITPTIADYPTLQQISIRTAIAAAAKQGSAGNFQGDVKTAARTSDCRQLIR
jgi:hypothetical protein